MNAAQIIAALAAQAAQGVRTNTAADAYVQAVARLMEHAGRWSAVSTSGLKCTIVVITQADKHMRCVVPAIGVCVACNGPVCFNHAMVSPMSGDMVCYGCVAKMTGVSPPLREDTQVPPPRGNHADEESRCTCNDFWRVDARCPVHGRASAEDFDREMRRHLRVLDLDGSADWEDIQYAYKQMVKKHHPDRHPPSRRKRQEVRIKKINAAFAWLKKHYEEAA